MKNCLSWILKSIFLSFSIGLAQSDSLIAISAQLGTSIHSGYEGVSKHGAQSWGHLIEMQVTGFLVVLFTLCLIYLISSSMGYVFKTIDAKTAQKKKLSIVPMPSIETLSSEADDLELVAVLSAAATVTLGKSHRAVKIRELAAGDKSWAIEGRTRQHQSHRIR